MMKTARNFTLLAAMILLCAGSLFAATLPSIAAPPVGERWFSVNMGGERVGFAHLSIQPQEGGYRILSDGSVKMRVMGFSRESSSEENYLVGPDLSIRSFSVGQRLDGSPVQLKGEVTRNGIKVVIESGGKKKERTIKLKGAVFPPEALNIFPLMHAAAPGKTFKIQMLDPESVKVKEVRVEVIGEETLSGSPALHMRNDLYPMVDNDVWVDLKGNSIKESVRDDLVVTLAEDEVAARAALANAALAKKDLVLDFSLIKTEPIPHPSQLKKLVLDVTGIPSPFPLLQGEQQQAQRQNGTVRFILAANSGGAVAEARPADLEPAPRIPSDLPEMLAQQKAILGETRDPTQAVRLLVSWLAQEIKGSVTDSQSPLETLKSRNGNCQAHARLYAALARSAGIPSRFVSGIVHAPEHGFLYHSWAESLVEKRWVPVDPTFGEYPANLTHIKLVEGDAPDDMALLAGVIGKLKARVVEKAY